MSIQNTGRFLTLDIFRGITVCFMIIVNSPGNGRFSYAPLQHASWHGFTPTDLVFPSFLFAVGNALAFAMKKYEQQGEAVFWKKIIKRSALIFLLGYLMYWFPFFTFDAADPFSFKPFAETRVLGVLQRIALCYFFGSIIIHYFSKKSIIIWSALLLFGYWLILLVFVGQGDPFSLEANAGSRLDLWLFGTNHLYIRGAHPFDPEGLLSTLPAIVNVLIGYLVGDYIRRNGVSFETIAKLMLMGAVLVLGALTWDMVFPINKKLWTSSFVLLTCGIDLLVIGFLIFVIEIKDYRNWTGFFNVFGKNPLFIYLLSELLLISMYVITIGDKSLWEWIYDNIFAAVMGPYIASFLFAVAYMLVCWLVGYVLDKRKIYIRV